MRFLLICCSLFCITCIEPYEFVIDNEFPMLVVEGQISDASFAETLQYPSEGRYFTVKLTYTSDVTNRRAEPVEGALVRLVSDQSEEWSYIESKSRPGLYILRNNEFKAKSDVKYRLKIQLTNQDEYDSSWEVLPNSEGKAIGKIGFEEVEKEIFRVNAGKKVLTKVKGVRTFVDIPAEVTEQSTYYKWKVDPAWIYIAPLTNLDQYDRQCWVTSKNYLNDYVLQLDNIGGGYSKELFFIETIRNERIFEDFSVLITQQILSERYFFFWKELKEQTTDGGIRDKPPYNLQTNIRSLNEGKTVSGYFGVVSEQVKRWYFNRDDLSYQVENNLKPDCLIEYGLPGEPPAVMCTSCLAYPNGEAVIGTPAWWR